MISNTILGQIKWWEMFYFAWKHFEASVVKININIGGIGIELRSFKWYVLELIFKHFDSDILATKFFRVIENSLPSYILFTWGNIT